MPLAYVFLSVLSSITKKVIFDVLSVVSEHCIIKRNLMPKCSDFSTMDSFHASVHTIIQLLCVSVLLEAFFKMA